MEYTAAQKKAIAIIDRNLQIIACAGSGKTRVVAARIVNILRKQERNGIQPENIVAFTFTDKAAAELKDRIARMYQDEFGHVRGLAGMYVGTIHGFCLDLLQKYVPHYLKFDVLDEVRQRLLVDRNYQKSGMASLGLKRWVESGLFVTILRVLREADSDPKVLDEHAVKAALETYQQLLDAHRYLDYDEMLLRAVVELESSGELRERIRNRVKYLTVDEYQDVNPIQEFLIRQIHDLGANLCVVGDDDQNIYQWRGSDVKHIVEFSKRYPGIAQVPLSVNFRSSSGVVDVAREAVEANSNRLPKRMESGGKVRESAEGSFQAAKLENYIGVICRLYRKDAAIQGASGLVHAIAESEKDKIAISIGPLSGRVTAKQITDAVRDALASGILEVHVLGWAFEANVGEVKSHLESRGKIKIQLIVIRPDTLAEGLKVTQPEMLFSPLALPDLEIQVRNVKGKAKVAPVTLKGVGVFERKKRTTDYYRADSGYVAAWYLDEDYDGDCFVDCQMFFDFAKTPNLKAALKAEVDPEEFRLQLTSQPFPVRGYKRTAVKVVDVYGT